jgi:hypothetical protein
MSGWLAGASLVLRLAAAAAAQPVTVSLPPDADSFVWSLAAANNYGVAGALSVSGGTATNSAGMQNGLFDSLMRFPMSNVVGTFDSALGPGKWMLTRARLVVVEMANPDNAMFNRGIGAFEVRWQAADGWMEGTGRPIAPTTDGVVWNDLPGLVNSGLDVSLGIFTNAANGALTLELGRADAFVADIRQGNEVSLRLAAASPEVGFTFNSRNVGNTNLQPRLELTAAIPPRPRIAGIEFAGASVFISFETASNWTYRLEAADQSGAWETVLRVPAQSVDGPIRYEEGVREAQRFYRLSVEP